jgi:hypothetical protein
MDNRDWVKTIVLCGTVLATAPHAGLLGGLLGGGGIQAIDPVGLGFDAKAQSNGGQGAAHVALNLESCLINANGTFTATWGYANGNPSPLLIPIGSSNKFYPGNQNQGQPASFQPGNHHNVFSTTFSGSTLTWIVAGLTASIQTCNCVPACPFHDSLLQEPWDSFNTARWQGDGDQQVQGGYFTIRPLAFSAFADWKNAAPVAVETNAVLHFDQRFRFDYPLPMPLNQSATLFSVNKDKDGTFTDYAYVNIGYTGLPNNRLFVEIFGADGGVGFDQYVETPIASEPQKFLDVDLRITSNAYEVAVDGMVVSTVTLVNALPQIDLFQAGVQRNLLGLEGSIDASYIYKTCK